MFRFVMLFRMCCVCLSQLFDCRFTTCLLFVFHRRMGTILLLSHTVWGELAFHTLSFTGRAKYEDSISCVTRWDFLFTTSVSATPVGLVKKGFTARATRLTTCFTEHSAPEIFIDCIYGSINATLELCRTVNNFRISTYAKLGLLGSQVEVFDTTHAADSIMMPCMSDMA